jgi:hypothetical protein
MTTNNNKQVFWLQIILRIRYLVLDHIPVDILFWGGTVANLRIESMSVQGCLLAGPPAQGDPLSSIHLVKSPLPAQKKQHKI